MIMQDWMYIVLSGRFTKPLNIIASVSLPGTRNSMNVVWVFNDYSKAGYDGKVP